jgi:hypothetical protein
MPPTWNGSGVRRDSLSEHLAIIRQLTIQRAARERAAALLTDCLLRSNGGSAIGQEEQLESEGAAV